MMKNGQTKRTGGRRMSLLGLLAAGCLSAAAQQYTGMSGLIHVPSAEMDAAGEARIGAHFLNREFTPDNFPYHTMSHYLSITPFSWMEIGYTCTLMKGDKVKDGVVTGTAYNQKDRYFSVKVQPLKEGRWWPAVAVGTNDPYGTEGPSEGNAEGGGVKSQYFSNWYVAATKHVDLKGHRIGAHLAYRKWKRDFNGKWNGVVGGITYRPAFQPSLRVMVEYTGEDVNVGMDWKLWRHLLLQSSLQDGKYFSGGLCFCLNLL